MRCVPFRLLLYFVYCRWRFVAAISNRFTFGRVFHSQDMPIVLGGGTMLEEFETNLLGLKAGEEKTFTVKFPKDYRAEKIAGKKAEFTVKVEDDADLLTARVVRAGQRAVHQDRLPRPVQEQPHAVAPGRVGRRVLR